MKIGRFIFDEYSIFATRIRNAKIDGFLYGFLTGWTIAIIYFSILNYLDL